ncbi:MAG TPA: histidine ammonia-lyase, partial [Candidatus Bathyarchaeia archaeon]|nr:histidine ammonia-lyase [Candidatus Bathyarchaeia archaeon]
AAQGVALRPKKQMGVGTRRVLQTIRRKIPPLDEDRSLHDDIEELQQIVRRGEIAKIVATTVGQ